MRKNDKRTLPDELEQMKQLCEEGYSASEIGRKLNRNHTTILFQLKQLGIKPSDGRKPIERFEKPEKIKKVSKNESSEIMEQMIKQGHFNTISPKTIIKQRIKDDVCINCGGVKRENMKLSHYCQPACIGEQKTYDR